MSSSSSSRPAPRVCMSARNVPPSWSHRGEVVADHQVVQHGRRRPARCCSPARPSARRATVPVRRGRTCRVTSSPQVGLTWCDLRVVRLAAARPVPCGNFAWSRMTCWYSCSIEPVLMTPPDRRTPGPPSSASRTTARSPRRSCRRPRSRAWSPATPNRRCSGCAQWWPDPHGDAASSRNWPTSCACTPSTTNETVAPRGRGVGRADDAHAGHATRPRRAAAPARCASCAATASMPSSSGSRRGGAEPDRLRDQLACRPRTAAAAARRSCGSMRDGLDHRPAGEERRQRVEQLARARRARRRRWGRASCGRRTRRSRRRAPCRSSGRCGTDWQASSTVSAPTARARVDERARPG